MQRTMSIGSTTYDLFVRTHREIVQKVDGRESIVLPLGAKERVKDIVETSGGGAANTAVGFARLQCHAHITGILSSDQWGEKLLQNFKREGVALDCATIVEGEVSSFSIILSASSGERVILFEPGTNEHIHDVTFDRETAATMDWVYLNRISEGSCVIQDDIIQILASTNAPKLTWNPGGCQLEVGIEERHHAELLRHTTLLLMNREEALEFTRQEELPKALELLRSAGPTVTCITDGRSGAITIDSEHVYFCPTEKDLTVTDTTGAGDAFGVGMSYALLQGWSLPEALKAGTLNAASVVAIVGAQAGLLRKEELEKRLRSTTLPVKEIPLSQVRFPSP